MIQGVRDPLGGVNSLWPIFGIANQLLASIALCLATTILLKMAISGRQNPRRALVTFLPLLWLLSVTFTAGWQKIFHTETDPKRPRIGFLQQARELEEKLPALEKAAADPTSPAAARKAVSDQKALIFNNRLDAFVAGSFLALGAAIFLISVAEWLRILKGSRPAKLSETEPVWLPGDAVASGNPAAALGALALGFSLVKELSGQADVDRAQVRAEECDCAEAQTPRGRKNVFLTVMDERYRGIRRCC